MSESIEGPVWLITGASSGLGTALTGAALRAGAFVVATARRVETLEHLADAWPSRVLALPLDVTRADQIDEAVAHAIAKTGRIDVLCNNAGRVLIGAVEEVTDAELRALFDLHVFAPMNLVRATLPHMRSRGTGTIVQISSMGSHFITPGFSSYTASKAALEGLSATLATEVLPHGIRVLIVQPGGLRTPVFSEGTVALASEMAAYADTVGETRQFIHAHDGHQVGDPQRTAEVVVQMVDDPAAPLRLPLGPDALENIGAAVEEIKLNLERLAAVARSTAYDADDASPRRGSGL